VIYVLEIAEKDASECRVVWNICTGEKFSLKLYGKFGINFQKFSDPAVTTPDRMFGITYLTLLVVRFLW